MSVDTEDMSLYPSIIDGKLGGLGIKTPSNSALWRFVPRNDISSPCAQSLKTELVKSASSNVASSKLLLQIITSFILASSYFEILSIS